MTVSPADQAFVDQTVFDYRAGLILFSIIEPRIAKAMRIMAEQGDLSSTVMASMFGKTRNAVISFCARVKPPIRLPGSTRDPAPQTGHKRKHVKTTDADLTSAVKYTRLVNTINRRLAAKRAKKPMSLQHPLDVRCPTCTAAVGEACYIVRNGLKVITRRHSERMNGLRAIKAEPAVDQPSPNETAGLPNVDLRRPSHVQRHMRFNRFNTADGTPRCAWHECMEPVMAPGKPYCTGHHRLKYGTKFVYGAVNYVIGR